MKARNMPRCWTRSGGLCKISVSSGPRSTIESTTSASAPRRGSTSGPITVADRDRDLAGSVVVEHRELPTVLSAVANFELEHATAVAREDDGLVERGILEDDRQAAHRETVGGRGARLDGGRLGVSL